MNLAGEALRTMSYAASIALEFQVLKKEFEILETAMERRESKGLSSLVLYTRMVKLHDNVDKILLRVITDLTGESSSLEVTNIQHTINYCKALVNKVDEFTSSLESEEMNVNSVNFAFQRVALVSAREYTLYIIGKIEKISKDTTSLIPTGPGSKERKIGATVAGLLERFTGVRHQAATVFDGTSADFQKVWDSRFHAGLTTGEILEGLSKTHVSPPTVTWISHAISMGDANSWYGFGGRSGLGVFGKGSDKRHFLLEYPEYLTQFVISGGDVMSPVSTSDSTPLKDCVELSVWTNWEYGSLSQPGDGSNDEKIAVWWNKFREESILMGIIDENTPSFSNYKKDIEEIRNQYILSDVQITEAYE